MKKILLLMEFADQNEREQMSIRCLSETEDKQNSQHIRKVTVFTQPRQRRERGLGITKLSVYSNFFLETLHRLDIMSMIIKVTVPSLDSTFDYKICQYLYKTCMALVMVW